MIARIKVVVFLKSLKTVTFFLTGRAGIIAKVLKETLRSYKALIQMLLKAGRLVGKTVKFGIDTFTILIAVVADFIKNIPKHLDTLKGWMDAFIASLAKMTRVFSDDVYKLYEKLGFTIKKVPQQPVLAIGIPVHIGDDFYALVKDGKVLFIGTKKEVEELARNLKYIDGKEIERYLDEFPELIKRAKVLNFKKKKLLDFYLGENKGYNSWTGGPPVKYLSESEKLKHQLFIKEGKLFDVNGKPYNSHDLENRFNSGKAIFVMDEYGRIFASTKNAPMKFHHSSFLSGKPVAMAGEIQVIEGFILEVNNRSGHYKPEKDFLIQFMDFLKNSGVDITFIDKKLI